MDLTAITTPFGLLDSETQGALKNSGGPYEFFSLGGFWDDVDSPSWQRNSTYRVKPAPPKPREWWIVGRKAWKTYEQACYVCEHGEKPVHVREVIE